MTCDTCGSTRLRALQGGNFWCERCGTLWDDSSNKIVPQLVDRLKEFLKNCNVWAQRFSVYECMYPEDQRPIVKEKP